MTRNTDDMVGRYLIIMILHYDKEILHFMESPIHYTNWNKACYVTYWQESFSRLDLKYMIKTAFIYTFMC